MTDSDRPNVLFLMSDEHNPRFLRGAEPVETPALDDLAANAAEFRSAYCPSPICGPSRKCMLTGKEQANADAWSNNSGYRGGEDTIPRTLADAGYETCLVGKMHFNGRRQFNGYEHRPYGDLTGHGVQQPGHQPDPIDPDRLSVQPRRQGIEHGTRIPGAGVTEIPESLLQEQVVARESIAWLREHRARRENPWFLTASFSRPHFPLTAPRRWIDRYWPEGAAEPPVDAASGHDHPVIENKRQSLADRGLDDEELAKARAAYFACVSFLDEVIGEFLGTLEAAGMLENTIVVYASDHGDMAGEHGAWWKTSYHEAAAGIPMVVQTPDHRSGARAPSAIETPVNLIDLYPTLCGLTGVEAPEGLDGMDLTRAVETGAEPDRGAVFTDQLMGWNNSFRMIREGRFKYVGFPEYPELLFDLEADPLETENLAPDAAEADPATDEAAAALQRLRGLYEETIDWEEIDREREAFEDEFEASLPTPPGTGNAYLLPDGRMVDAATPLYKPDELADDPARIIEDFPEDR